MQLKKFNLAEYKTDFTTFIGGWYIDEHICKELINFFKKNQHLQKPGKTRNKDISTIDENIKVSTDMHLTTNYAIYPTNLYLNELQKCLINYLIKYESSNNVSPFMINDYNIQYYKKNEGYKKWHCERTGLPNSNRHLVFMTYLNDVEDGGTEFKYQNLIVPAKKGLTLIWPTDWTHTHRGQISKNFEKYIVTGWFNYNV